MLSLKSRRDQYKLILPKEFIPKPIEEKYTKMLIEKRSFITSPIDLLNETIQGIDILGFNDASVSQQQQTETTSGIGSKLTVKKTMLTDTYYRSPNSDYSLVDKTINIRFRHILGYINYFILFESFIYMYDRKYKSFDLPKYIEVDLLDNTNSIYSKIILEKPIIDGLDMLSFDSTAPIAESSSFTLIIKYSGFDYQFVSDEQNNTNIVL